LVSFLLCTLYSKRINQVGTNFYHATDSLVLNEIDIGVQMNFIRLNSGRFLILDTLNLNSSFVDEINMLTQNGTLIEAVLGTHPFHTLFFPGFYKHYPRAKYYGTPRHLRVIPGIPWAGSLWDCNNRVLWPEIRMRIPRGAEFVAPQPESTNHFSGIHVFHPASGILHVDDTINVLFDALLFHPTLVTDGLYHIPEAPTAFGNFVQNLINDWNFNIICVAHKATPFCNTNARSALQTTLDISQAILLSLEGIYWLNPNQTQAVIFKAMEAHENQPLCSGNVIKQDRKANRFHVKVKP